MPIITTPIGPVPIQDTDLAKPRPALDHQATAFGENLRHM
jgi:hypothetical protein